MHILHNKLLSNSGPPPGWDEIFCFVYIEIEFELTILTYKVFSARKAEQVSRC